MNIISSFGTDVLHESLYLSTNSIQLHVASAGCVHPQSTPPHEGASTDLRVSTRTLPSTDAMPYCIFLQQSIPHHDQM
jgi:hypothetical protein